MALLASCWLLIENFLIPEGYLKWFYLSFYMHPIFLFFCQIFLWVNTLYRWLLLILFIPFKLTRYPYSYIHHILRLFMNFMFFFPSSRTNSNSSEEVDETVWYDCPQSVNQFLIAGSYSSWSTALPIQYEVGAFETPRTVFCEEELTNYYTVGLVRDHVDGSFEEAILCSSVDSSGGTSLDEECTTTYSFYGPSSPSSISSAVDVEANLSSPSPSESSICTSNSPLIEIELIGKNEEVEEVETDAFYVTYCEKMRWFDLLNQDRTLGISAFLKSEDISIPYGLVSALGKMGKTRILKSLEADLEMIYVAQSCLSWEALYYQHRKVESVIACSASNTSIHTSGFYSGAVAAKFQNFQILLERFMEDEMFEDKRFWNYVRKRSSLESFMQVPQVSGCVEDEKEGGPLEGIRPTEMLKVIEKCIKAFWLYVKIDDKKPWWRTRSFLSWTRPPLEDPRDLRLLNDLTKRLHQKELQVKALKGKKQRWLRRGVSPLQDPSQKKEMLFTMIELKLISRVLMMSVISTSQLCWCQEKLNNIEFKDGKPIIKPCTGSLLFPSS